LAFFLAFFLGDFMQARLQKWISEAGLLSRRKAEAAIAEGRVRLNGKVVTELGTVADLSSDVLELDGVRVHPPVAKKTWVFHKPRGILTTKSDDRGRRTVMEFFQDDLALNPVGRLDFESEGLLLMTHDGDLLLKLTHPRYGFQKIYEVQLNSKEPLSNSVLAQLVSGVELEDGVGKFDECQAMTGASQYRVKVSEGRNRFIRRMFTAVGFTVTRLKRTEMGPVLLGGLAAGQKRPLTDDELAAIQKHLEGV
jgi:23S rRNA pseudouridine2605 synthase